MRHLLPILIACGAALSVFAQPLAAATQVTTESLARLLVYPEFSAPATVHSLNDSRLSAEIMASITAIPVRVGDQVKRDQLLLELDCRSYQLRHRSQQARSKELSAQFSLAESQLKRARSLRKQRNISDEQVEQRETELSVLRSKLRFQQQLVEESRIQTERCQIKAPFDGVVLERIAQQ